MPQKPFLDVGSLDLNKTLISQEEIYDILPHRHEFMCLDAIVHLDEEARKMAGYRDLRDDEFWIRGHIPGRPLFPGVMMIETAAHLVSYYAMKHNPTGGFLGFSAVNGVKFRGTVVPGQRLVMVGKMVEVRPRRATGEVQGFVDEKMVFEGTITGMWI